VLGKGRTCAKCPRLLCAHAATLCSHVTTPNVRSCVGSSFVDLADGINANRKSSIAFQRCEVARNSGFGINVSGGQVLVIDSQFASNAYDVRLKPDFDSDQPVIYADKTALSLSPDSDGAVQAAVSSTQPSRNFLSEDDPRFLDLQRVCILAHHRHGVSACIVRPSSAESLYRHCCIVLCAQAPLRVLLTFKGL
jgi:hypothetical protein